MAITIAKAITTAKAITIATALIEVDVQNDFCPAYTGKGGKIRPAGALAVANGDAVIPPLNHAAEKITNGGGKVIASQDWHPSAHCSFASSNPGTTAGVWPDHCVQNCEGAQLHDDLDRSPINLILRKGYRENLDSYSVFFENDRSTPTGLDGFLKGLGIRSVVIGGLATDYCVLYSVMDALRLGYETIVLQDAVRGVNIPEGSVDRALERMRTAGAVFMDSGEL
jgi:nicotinamidase/pyrazinamidase